MLAESPPMRAAGPPSGRLALALIVAGGAVLRLATLGVQSFSDDELFTTWLVRMSLGDLLSTIPESEATPHTYYVLQWLVAQVLGTGEVAMRILPALAGTATIAVVYAAGAAGASRRVGLAAAALVAVNPFLIWFSQEARAYALLILLMALSVLALIRFERGGSGRALAGWAAASAAAIATHYFAAFLVVPAAAWIAFGGAPERRSRVAAAVPLVAGIALLPLALHQREAVGDPGGIGDSNLAERLAAVPKNFLVGYTFPAEGVVSALVLLAGAVLLVLAVTRTSRDERRLAIGMTLLAACGVALPLVVAPFGFDYVSSRNVIASLVPLSLALGCAFAAHRAAPAVLAAVAALSVFAVLGVALEREHQRRDWQGGAEALGFAHTDRALIFSPGFRNLGPFEIYYGHGIEAYPGPAPFVDEIAVVGLAENTSFGPGAPEPPDGAAPAPPPGFRLAENRRTSTYRLLRYRARRPRPVPFRQLVRFDLRDRAQVVLLQRGPR